MPTLNTFDVCQKPNPHRDGRFTIFLDICHGRRIFNSCADFYFQDWFLTMDLPVGEDVHRPKARGGRARGRQSACPLHALSMPGKGSLQ